MRAPCLWCCWCDAIGSTRPDVSFPVTRCILHPGGVTAPAPLALASELHPWEQQPSETPQAWAAFEQFLALSPPDRADDGVARVAEQMSKRRSTIARWHARYRWAERAAAYEQHREHVRSLSNADAARVAHERNGQVISEFVDVAWEALRLQDPSAWSPQHVIKAIESAVRLQATHWGAPTERVQVDGQVHHQIDPSHRWSEMTQSDRDAEIEQLLNDVRRKKELAAQAEADAGDVVPGEVVTPTDAAEDTDGDTDGDTPGDDRDG